MALARAARAGHLLRIARDACPSFGVLAGADGIGSVVGAATHATLPSQAQGSWCGRAGGNAFSLTSRAGYKTTTGIVGLPVDPNAPETLKKLLKECLRVRGVAHATPPPFAARVCRAPHSPF